MVARGSIFGDVNNSQVSTLFLIRSANSVVVGSRDAPRDLSNLFVEIACLALTYDD